MSISFSHIIGGKGACLSFPLLYCWGACLQTSPIHRGTRPTLKIQPIYSQRLCLYAAESPDDPGRRRLRSGSKVHADAGSPVIGEEPAVRRSKRKSRQTLESSDDEGGADGQPAAKRHLDLQPNDQVRSGC